MTDSAGDPPIGATYVLGSVWHIVDGQDVHAARLGRVYLLKCYRWMSAADAEARGLYRERLPQRETLCRTCEENAARRLDQDSSMEDIDREGEGGI